MTRNTRTIDSHLHLWDLGDGGYEWLTPEAGKLYRTFGAEEAANELRVADVDGAVLVQADNTVADTRAMLAAAAAHEWVLGVVGWIPLDDPQRAIVQLDEWVADGRVCGIRHLVHIDLRTNFLELGDVRRSISNVAESGLAFDVPATSTTHLNQIAALANDMPDLRVVVDHLGKPPHEATARAGWRSALAKAAENENVVAKLSGLRVAGQSYSVEALSEIWDIALNLFGPSRLLWGSDWPMTVPDGGYGPTLAVLEDLVETLSSDEQDDIWSRTATRIYALGSRG